MTSSDRGGEWLRLSTLEHFAYCPRQAWLLLDGVWLDNHLTVSGAAAHEHVDSGGTDRRRGVRVHHRVGVAHHDLKIYGVADSVEESAEGDLLPVEHKLGRAAGDMFPSLVQVVGQALCLESMTDRRVPRVAIYIIAERRREYFETDEYRDRVVGLIRRAHDELSEFVPATYSTRLCRSCSVRNACQPEGADWR